MCPQKIYHKAVKTNLLKTDQVKIHSQTVEQAKKKQYQFK